MINYNQNELCTGCGACEQICPKGAIKLTENDEGFLYPVIDKEKCINCNKCSKVCQINNIDKIIHKNKPKYYAGFKKNKEERRKSASGGIADAIAQYVIQKGGYICAAAWIDGELKHIITNNYNDFNYMRGSKYFQSKIGHCYKEIENLLKDDKIVAFIGTPCQAAGLRLFLGKEYKNLYIADIICHGVPSQKIFNRFLDDNGIKSAGESHITIDFRDGGWKDRNLSIRHDDKLVYSNNKTSYVDGFLNNLFLRNSCYKCPFSQEYRCSDITIGDYWGIERLDKSLDDNLGVSLISVNSFAAVGGGISF